MDNRLILVGGTGRSGSTVVGRLLDQHPELTLARPMEVRFIAGNDGFADALRAWLRKPGSARATQASELAVERLRTRWFERAEHVGLHESMSADEVAVWSAEYLDSVGGDATAATRLLCDRILGRIAARLGAQRLVDTTPANSRSADRIEPIYPESSVVTVLRDGRDVAASFVQQSFGPDDVFVALEQWEARMLRSHRAAAASRPDRVLEVDLADLVSRDRIGSLTALCDFLQVPLDAQMAAWFEAEVTPDGMHPGRWRRQFDAQTTARIEAAYEAACARLAAEGVRLPDSSGG